MSWNPFKKTRRTRTEDVEFEREVNRLRQMEAVSKRMYKDMRKCNESETALVRAEQRLVSNIKTCPLARSEPLKQTEYEKQQSRLEKLERKASVQTKVDMMHRAVSSARLDYERVQSRVMAEMPELFEGRVAYFDLCLQAVLKSQALYYRECSGVLCEGLRRLQHGSGDLMNEEEIVKTTEKYLADIRALSIVGDSPSS